MSACSSRHLAASLLLSWSLSACHDQHPTDVTNLRLAPAVPTLTGYANVAGDSSTATLNIVLQAKNMSHAPMKIGATGACVMAVRLYPDPKREEIGSTAGFAACDGALAILVPGDSLLLLRSIASTEFASQAAGIYSVNIGITLEAEGRRSLMTTTMGDVALPLSANFH